MNEYKIIDIEDQFNNVEEITFEDLWDQQESTNKPSVNENGNYMITLTEPIQIESKNGWTNITRLFKHNVTKERWRTKIFNDYVETTKDHSIMVERDGNILGIEPDNILPTDYLIYNHDERIQANDNNVSIQKIGMFDNESVYDLEVADNSHTFYGNNILLHNSLYVNLSRVVKHVFPDKVIDWNNRNDVNKIIQFVDGTLQQKLNTHCANFICERFKTSERRIEFKREKICSGGDFVAKKRYVLRVLNNEGIDCDKFTYMGVDIKKNELPTEIKNLLCEIVEDGILTGFNNNEYQKRIRKIYEQYQNLSLNEIAFIKNYNTEKKSIGFLQSEKGANAHAKAANNYNMLLERFKLTSIYEPIKVGDRFRYAYVNSSNPYGLDVIGWKDIYPKEFEDKFQIDRTKMVEKTVMSPLKRFETNHQWSPFNPNEIPILGEIDIDDL